MSVGQVLWLETNARKKTLRVVGEIDPDRAYSGRGKRWPPGTEPREDEIFVSVSIGGAFASSAQFTALKHYKPVAGVFYDTKYQPMSDIAAFGGAEKGYWAIAVAFADEPKLDDATQSVVRVLSVLQRKNGTLELYDWTRIVTGQLREPQSPQAWQGALPAAALPKQPAAGWGA